MMAMLAASSLPAASEADFVLRARPNDLDPWNPKGRVIGATRGWRPSKQQSVEEIREAKAAAEAKRQRKAAKRLQ